MMDDVEQVARALCEIGIGSKRCPCADSGVFRCVNELPGTMARAAMAATREIDAEALRNVAEEWPYLSAQENKRRETMLSIAADWLQQRANDVKGCGNG